MLDHYLKTSDSHGDAFVAAAGNSRVDVMKALIELGVDINFRDSRYNQTALHAAASTGSKKTVAFLIEKGASLDSLDGISMTPLMHACSRGKKIGSAIALLLLGHGADATFVRAEDGMTAYKFALWGKCLPEVLDSLRGAGAQLPEAGFQIIHLV